MRYCEHDFISISAQQPLERMPNDKKCNGIVLRLLQLQIEKIKIHKIIRNKKNAPPPSLTYLPAILLPARNVFWPIPAAPYSFFANIVANSRQVYWNCTSMRWTPLWIHYTKSNGSVYWLEIPMDSVDATYHFGVHSDRIHCISP